MAKSKSPQRTIALCYIRQSVTRDETDTNSPERQRANIEALCNQHGWVAEWYEDAEGHKSGRKVKNRPAWLALEKRLSAPDVVALVANDLSRLHRKGWRVGNLLDLVDQYGVRLMLAAPGKQIDFSSPQGRAVAQLSAIFDEWYADDISLRSTDSIIYRKKRGITVGIPPFGTVRDSHGYLKPSDEGAWLLSDGKFQAGEENQPPAADAIWRSYHQCAGRILELYSTGQYGLDKLAYKMQAEGWAFRDRNSEPRPIDGDDVRRVVANWAEYGGYVSEKRARERHPFDQKAGAVILNEEQAVFPVQMLYRVGDVRRKRSIRRPVDDKINSLAYPYPLSGLVWCAHCESRAQVEDDERLKSKLSGKNNAQGSRRYRHKHGVKCGCVNRSVMDDILEGEFARLLGLLTVREEEVELLNLLALHATKGGLRGSEHDPEAEKQAAIAKCQRRIEAARRLFLDGDLAYDEYLRRKEENEREIALWEARSADAEQVAVELAMCVEAVSKIARLWDRGIDEDRQGLARSLFEYLVFDLDTHRITDFRMKPWADRFITLRASLYDEKTKTLIQEVLDEGNHVTPTGFRATKLSTVLNSISRSSSCFSWPTIRKRPLSRPASVTRAFVSATPTASRCLI